MDISKLIRKCVKHFEPYIPGKSIESLKRELGLKRIIKLASNENPLGPSVRAIRAMRENASSVYLYPDGFGLSLRQALAAKHKVPVSNVFLGSGSDEIIEIIAKTYFNPHDNIIVSQHAFIRYKMAGELMDITVKEIPMKNLTHDVHAMAEAIDRRTKAVFIANPNNPTGTYVNSADMRAFLKHVPKNIIVVLDEAYFEYASLEKDYPDGIALFKQRFKNVISLRTFSKIYGLAGLRVGYGIGDASLIEAMDRVRPPFNVTRISMLAAEASLGDTDIVMRSQAMVVKGRKQLYQELNKLKISYIPSAGNFVLIKVPGSGQQMFQRLLVEGIIVRAMDEYGLNDYIRVTIGTPQEMKLFLKAFKKAMRSLL